MSTTIETPSRLESVTADDRRRSERLPTLTTGWLSGEAGNPQSRQQQVEVVDLSLHGLGFRCPRTLEVGAEHWICIAAGPLHVSSRVRIISCRLRDDQTFDVGAEFF